MIEQCDRFNDMWEANRYHLQTYLQEEHMNHDGDAWQILHVNTLSKATNGFISDIITIYAIYYEENR